MKWMMWRVALLIAVGLPVAVGAQAGTEAKGDKIDQKMLKDSTYTGCVEPGSTPGTFMLTHLATHHIGKDALQ